MRVKKYLFPVLFVGTRLGLILRGFGRAFTKPISAKTVANSASYDVIDAYVVEQMHRLNIPGASLAIVEGDQIVHRRGFGKARPSGETPTLQTPFFIGSLTKSITALAVMQLVEAGKVEQDAPVQRYLPWFRVADPQASAQMTVRHLLNQTSGLPILPGLVNLNDFDDRPGAVERQARALSSIQLSHPVGSKWEYSNLNYNLLGLVIEAASGESYPDYIKKHIFGPLDMRHSYTSKADAQQDNLANGHRHWFSLPFPVPDPPVPVGSLPSGQLISCAEDLAHYLIAHLNGGRYGDVQILSAAGIAELHRGAAECTMFGITSGRYGMGWFDIDLGATKTYSHGGNTPDFSSFAGLVPELQKGVVILFNADPYGLPPVTGEVGMGATALLAGQQPPPIRLDFLQWIMRLLPMISLVQMAGVIATLRLIRGWRMGLSRRPSSGRLWGRHLLLPLIPNLAPAALPLILHNRGIFPYLQRFNPDLAWIARISGLLAGVWAILHTGLILRRLRKAP